MYDTSVEPLRLGAPPEEKAQHYRRVIEAIQRVLQGECNWVAAMATVSCLLQDAFDYFHWTGFYQVDPAAAQELVIGPYQGHLGCLRIPYVRGVCGAAAREGRTVRVADVATFPGYIACASSTLSEIVVPVFKGVVQVQPAASGDLPGTPDASDAGGSAGGCQGKGVGAAAPGPAPTHGPLLAVLDIDSDYPDAFDEVDEQQLERLCMWLGQQGFV